MAKKQRAAESIHDRDRIIVRLPDGMRDELAALAEANGRSMTSEVVAAIEKHLKGVDRITQLWDLFEKHRENLEAVPHIWDAVEYLESNMDKLMGVEARPLTSWRLEMEEKARKAAQLREDIDAVRKSARALEDAVDVERQKRKDPPA